MLYDPKWEIKTADPFALESLIAWLESKPAGETYCYRDNGRCLLGQYFTSMGFEHVVVGAREFDHSGQRFVEISDDFHDISIEHPRTFGAALKRACAAKAAA